jgi:two-component system LytT family response regulator
MRRHSPVQEASAMLTALLIDDEPPANERLRTMLKHHGRIEVVAVAESLSEARARLAERVVDVIFLDVEIPGGSGLDLLPEVPAGTEVVFVTAYETYAVEAFAASALDYLVKPVHPDRLDETVCRLEEMTMLRRLKAAHAGGDSSLDDGMEASERSGGRATDAGPVTKRGRMLTDMIHLPREGKKRTEAVMIGDICWIESLQNYTRVGLRNPGRVALFRRRLWEWEADLPAGLFTRLGKSLIVQLAAIQETEWKSRDETLISFGPGLAPLVIGRPAALRLQNLLAGEGPGAIEGS